MNDKLTFFKSPLNYVGGKNKIINQLLPLFPKDINTFVDLFCGGCEVGLNVTCKNLILNDYNLDVINFYNYLKTNDAEKILELIDRIILENDLSMYNKESYYTFRAKYNKFRNPLEFFVLVAHSFNNNIRYNRNNKFNVASGVNRAHFTNNMRSNLKILIEKLQASNVKLSSISFIDFDTSQLTNNDYVYLDPPYLISNYHYIKSYTKGTETKLLELLNILNTKGVIFGLSNIIEHKGLKNQLLIDWIKDNNIKVYDINKNYNVINRGKILNGETREVFVTNYKV